MQRAVTGNREAYRTVLNESTKLLRPYLSRRLSQRSDVEDVLQEILLSVHRARHTYDGQRPYRPWLFAIARFRLSDYLRTRYADPLRLAADLSAIESSAGQDVTESPLSYELITKEIERLPGKQPEILRLLHREGHTAKEAAAKLGMNESAVKVAAHRAYKVLRTKLMEP